MLRKESLRHAREQNRSYRRPDDDGLSVAALAVGATTAAGLQAVAEPKAAPAAAPSCSTAYKIEQKLSTGTTWRMCWHYESEAGLVLENISYQPKGEAQPIKVLTSAKLGQIHPSTTARPVRRPHGRGLRPGSDEDGTRRVSRRHHQDREDPQHLGPAAPERQRPVHHHPFARPRLPHGGRHGQQGLPDPGQGPADLHRQQGRLPPRRRIGASRTTAPSA